ncbi:MAG: GNAT family N-acetyltransferase [Alteromonadaceae bacterium]|nr:GNAT family N-acetyltransferase [Alteromonadaceae bacterium]
MAYKVKGVLWQEAEAQLKSLRKAVFVLEWQLPESAEFDDLDNKAFHVLMFSQDNHPIATARLTHDGQIGRIAVLPKHRNTSVYNTLFTALLKQANSQNIEQIHVQSALNRVDYHREKGFEPIGPVFMEAGIPMQKMVCQRQQFDLPDVKHIH